LNYDIFILKRKRKKTNETNQIEMNKLPNNRTEILKYIPQRHHIVMIDKLLDFGEDYAVTALQISADNIFCCEGLFTEPGLIENIAQTAAVHNGYKSLSQNHEVPLGFIGAIKQLKINKLPKVETIITTEIRITNSFGKALVVSGLITQEAIQIASCEMTIFTK